MAIVKTKDNKGNVRDFNVKIQFTHIVEVTKDKDQPFYNYADSYEIAKKILASVARDGATGEIFEIVD